MMHLHFCIIVNAYNSLACPSGGGVVLEPRSAWAHMLFVYVPAEQQGSVSAHGGVA